MFKFFFVKVGIGLFSLFCISYSQDTRLLQMRAGDFLTYIDMYNAQFSILDLSQENIDFSSLLFGSSTMPSSYVVVYVDDKIQTVDQMIPLYPLGMSVGAQVDGIFLAGTNNDIQVELAFFPMNISGTSKIDTIGIATRISNTSQSSTRKVSVRIMLDTDIGETSNDPLIYLPTREKITNAFVLDAKNIPPYLFIGKILFAELKTSQEAFYLYPFLSTNIPSAITIGNWKRISDKNKTQLNVPTSLSYNSTSLKDIGISIYFGTYELNPKEHQSFGIAMSKEFSTLWPILENQTIDAGVFNTNRFVIEEILRNMKGFPITQQEMDSTTIDSFLIANPVNSQNQQRQLFRQQQIGKGFSNTFNEIEQSNSNMPKQMRNGVIWDYLYEIDLQMRQIDQDLNRYLENKNKEKIYDSPPSTGILKNNFY